MKSRQSLGLIPVWSGYCREFCEISVRDCLVVVIQWPEHWQLKSGALVPFPVTADFHFPIFAESRRKNSRDTQYLHMFGVSPQELPDNQQGEISDAISLVHLYNGSQGVTWCHMTTDYWMGAKVSHDYRLLVTRPFHCGHDTHFKLLWTELHHDKNNIN